MFSAMTDLEKQPLRARFLSLRRTLPGNGAALARRLLAGLETLGVAPGTHAVGGYWPLAGEADARPSLEELAARGFACALPVVVRKAEALVFRAWTPGDDLIPGLHGSLEPRAGAAEMEPTLLLVPLVAFDREGYRLGMGGGYYDRTLAALRARRRVVAVGLAHGAQRVDRLPRDLYDEPLDWVLTEDGLEGMR